ncbi:hypothetical protein GCM10018772_11190 [Streptomyces fumanus]|uniref:Uncharacterized protein n=1 Tax=Streptomyces fumanus TaxID=67302 RepID=A0A919A6F9_9ACTN|nr:hypothetical protein GCM10018772_11190 [Streptomyces fumanus]
MPHRTDNGSSSGALADTPSVCSPCSAHRLPRAREEVDFAQRPGEKRARLWHSDADWEMFRVDDHSIRLTAR